MTLPELLRTLDKAEVLLSVKGEGLSASPRSRITPELQKEILRHRTALVELFREPPAWPPSRGRSGPLENWSHVVGDGVRISDGRDGRLRAILYDTRSGRLRCRVELSDGPAVLSDPEDVLPAILVPLVAGRRG